MTLRRLMAPVWRRQWPWLALGVCLMLASTLAALVLLGLSGWLITASAMVGAGLLAAVDIFTPGAGIRLAALTRTAARYGERLATHRASLSLLAGLRVGLLGRLLELDEIQLRRLRRGDVLERLTRDVEALDPLFSSFVGPILTALVLLAGLSFAFGLFLGPMAALVMVVMGALATAISLATVRAGLPVLRAQATDDTPLRRACTEGLEGLKSLIAENRIDDQAATIESISNRQIARRVRLDRIDALGRGLLTAAGLGATWAVLVLVGQRLDTAPTELSGPAGILIVLVALGGTEAWQVLPAAWRQALRSKIAATRLGSLADTEPALPQCSDAGNEAPQRASISARSLTFTWPDGVQPVVENLAFSIEPGERLLVTGASGCGKTTLALLMMRQTDPDEGSIQLGGRDLREIDPDTLRALIGYLPQHPVVFADTLAANLRVADPDAGDERLASVLEQAGLGNWLAGLEKGLETWLDEAGATLSGGEQRRLGLARLMLREPLMVILDEPTTGLDKQTGASLSRSLDAWLGDRSAVLISHEPEQLPRYDRELTL